MLADIPGLIEGAHEGHGLGDRFLGHVERCGALVHLVDATGEHAGAAYRTIRRELEAYGGGVAEKPEIVALSKVDAVDEETLKTQNERLKRAMRTYGPPLAARRQARPAAGALGGRAARRDGGVARGARRDRGESRTRDARGRAGAGLDGLRFARDF